MSVTAIQIPDELLDEASKFSEEAGFESTDAFVRWALREKLRELRRDRFYVVTDRVKQGLAERGITPEEILEDFDQFRRGDHR